MPVADRAEEPAAWSKLRDFPVFRVLTFTFTLSAFLLFCEKSKVAAHEVCSMRYVEGKAQHHNDSVFGFAPVMESIVIVGVVCRNISETAKMATEMTCNTTMTVDENSIGRIGLKRQAIATKATTHQYLRRVAAWTTTRAAPSVITKLK